MRLLSSLQAFQLAPASLPFGGDRGWLGRGGRGGRNRRAVHEEAGNVVDRGTVNQGLQKICPGAKECKKGDDKEALLIGASQLDENTQRTHLILRG